MNQENRIRLYDRLGRYGAVLDAARAGQLSPRESLAALSIVHRVLRRMSDIEAASGNGREFSRLTEDDCVDGAQEEREWVLRRRQR